MTEINLERATIFADSNRGQYIPQFFAENVDRSKVTGVSYEDYAVLASGPQHEHYWDAWADVRDNAIIQDPVLGECFLHHDEDLWVVPVDKEVTVLGFKFRPFTKMDWQCYAGAEEGSLICHTKESDLIWDPKKRILSEVGHTEDPHGWQRDWTYVQIAGEDE